MQSLSIILGVKAGNRTSQKKKKIRSNQVGLQILTVSEHIFIIPPSKQQMFLLPEVHGTIHRKGCRQPKCENAV